MTYPDLQTGLANLETSQWCYDQAAKTPKTQAVLEIGVYRGRTTCWLASGALSGKGAKVFGVDPWDLPDHRPLKPKFAQALPRELAHKNIAEAGVADAVIYIQAYSADAAESWKGPKIGLLYVDGDHSEAGVLTDWSAWRPHLANTATVAFDDYGAAQHPDVKRVVDRLHSEGQITEPAVVGGRLAVARLRRK